jgi:hypothetical protein
MSERWRVERRELRLLRSDIHPHGGSSLGLHLVDDGTGRQRLFKVYTPEVSSDVDDEAMEALLQWPASLSPQVRRVMLPQLAFPEAVVVDGSQVLGVLMSEASSRFTRVNRRNQRIGRFIDQLSNTPAMASTVGATYFEPPHRLALLGSLLRLLADLHLHGVVVGDLQPQNILVTDDPREPAVLLLDCDALWIRGRHTLANLPLQAQRYMCPYAPWPLTEESDTYKAGLVAVRCLKDNESARPFDENHFRRFLPGWQVERLAAMIRPGRRVHREGLRELGAAWRARVGPGGELYNETDVGGVEPWRPLIRVSLDAPIPPLAEPPLPVPSASEDLPPSPGPPPTSLPATVTAAALVSVVLLLALLATLLTLVRAG